MSAPEPVPLKSGDLATTPVAPEPVAPAVKKPHALTGRKASDKQMEALRKGMEALKTRREAIQKAKEEGTFNPDDFKPKAKVVIIKEKKPKACPFTGVVRETVFTPRKVPEPKFRKDIEDLKSTIAELKGQMIMPPPIVKEVVKEVPVDRIVEKEVIRETKVSGREMLDAIFFRK
jgi:hypothetical protein